MVAFGLENLSPLSKRITREREERTARENLERKTYQDAEAAAKPEKDRRTKERIEQDSAKRKEMQELLKTDAENLAGYIAERLSTLESPKLLDAKVRIAEIVTEMKMALNDLEKRYVDGEFNVDYHRLTESELAGPFEMEAYKPLFEEIRTRAMTAVENLGDELLADDWEWTDKTFRADEMKADAEHKALLKERERLQR